MLLFNCKQFISSSKFFFRWDPICCTSKNIIIDENACINDRINQPNENFEHEIANDLIYRGLQCWHQYNDNNTLFDIIWKMEICPFSSPMGTLHKTQGLLYPDVPVLFSISFPFSRNPISRIFCKYFVLTNITINAYI